jgi:hypothetical protein
MVIVEVALEVRLFDSRSTNSQPHAVREAGHVDSVFVNAWTLHTDVPHLLFIFSARH